MLTQAGLKFCSPASAILLLGFVLLSEVQLGFRDSRSEGTLPSCHRGLELGKGMCRGETGSFFLSHSTFLMLHGQKRTDLIENLLRYLLIGREILRELWD